MDNLDQTTGENKIIQELITHINKLESRINSIQDTISETKDLQTVNKLDIINMKNEMDKVKIVLPSISAEQAEQIQAISKFIEQGSKSNFSDIIRKIQSVDNNMNSLNQRIISLESNDQQTIYKPSKSKSKPIINLADMKNIKSRLREIDHLKTKIDKISTSSDNASTKKMKEEISALKSAIKMLKPQSNVRVSSTKNYDKSISDLMLEFKRVKEKVSGLKQVKVPENIMDIDELRKDVNELLPISEDIDSINNDLGETISSLNLLQKEISKISRTMVRLENSSSLQTKKVTELNKKMPAIKKEVSSLKKLINTETAKTKKETISFILKELKRMVN